MGGDWQKDWVCVCYKGIQHLGKFRYAIAARAVALAVKRSLSEYNKKIENKVTATGIDGKWSAMNFYKQSEAFFILPLAMPYSGGVK